MSVLGDLKLLNVASALSRKQGYTEGCLNLILNSIHHVSTNVVGRAAAAISRAVKDFYRQVGRRRVRTIRATITVFEETPVESAEPVLEIKVLDNSGPLR